MRIQKALNLSVVFLCGLLCEHGFASSMAVERLYRPLNQFSSFACEFTGLYKNDIAAKLLLSTDGGSGRAPQVVSEFTYKELNQTIITSNTLGTEDIKLIPTADGHRIVVGYFDSKSPRSVSTVLDIGNRFRTFMDLNSYDLNVIAPGFSAHKIACTFKGRYILPDQAYLSRLTKSDFITLVGANYGFSDHSLVSEALYKLQHKEVGSPSEGMGWIANLKSLVNTGWLDWPETLARGYSVYQQRHSASNAVLSIIKMNFPESDLISILNIFRDHGFADAVYVGIRWAHQDSATKGNYDYSSLCGRYIDSAKNFISGISCN